MKNILITLIGILVLPTFAMSQYKTIVYDYEKNLFSEGQPLPAESFMMFTGRAIPGIELIKVAILNTKKEELYTTKWKKSFEKQDVFNIPLNMKLRQNTNYSFEINYYRDIEKEEKSMLYNSLQTSIKGYLGQSYTVNKKSVESNNKLKEVMKMLNSIVNQGTGLYENNLNSSFEGFSEIVRGKLEQIDDLNLKKSKLNVFGDKEDEKGNEYERNQKYFTVIMDELKEQIGIELIQYINRIDYISVENRYVSDYPTESGRNILPINIGYGAIYNSGNFSNLNYGRAPYVGLSFPLGNSNFNKVLSKTSISFGAYLNGFDDANGNRVKGPIVDVPLFLGVGVNVFKVFKVNVGATALEKYGTNSSGFSTNNIYIRPSVNVSFEFGVWMGLLNK